MNSSLVCTAVANTFPHEQTTVCPPFTHVYTHVVGKQHEMHGQMLGCQATDYTYTVSTSADSEANHCTLVCSLRHSIVKHALLLVSMAIVLLDGNVTACFYAVFGDFVSLVLHGVWIRFVCFPAQVNFHFSLLQYQGKWFAMKLLLDTPVKPENTQSYLV